MRYLVSFIAPNGSGPFSLAPYGDIVSALMMAHSLMDLGCLAVDLARIDGQDFSASDLVAIEALSR